MSQFLEAKQIPIWLDCDPGHDDAFAILLCAHHPNIDFLGVSTVHGNASLQKTTNNASSVLVALNRSDVPIYPGANKPFSRRALHAPDIHGESGLDGTNLLPPPKPAVGWNANSLPAVSAMYTALKAQTPGTAWLVATGTLTNVALLLAVYPDIAEHLAGISIMGGAFGDCHSTVNQNQTSSPEASATRAAMSQQLEARIGNITPHAEFNIYCDPESALAVLSNPNLSSKIILIPLDITHTVLATPKVLHNVLGSDGSGTAKSPLRQMMYDLLIFFADTYATVFGITEGPPLHDPIAVAAVLHRERVHQDLDFDYGGGTAKDGFFGSDRYAVDVATEGKHGDGSRLGATTLVPLGADGGAGADVAGVGGHVLVPRSLDVARFWECVYACLAQAEFFSSMGGN